MDTVVGRLGRDRQCVLTLFMRRIGLRLYILLPNKSGSSVAGALDSLQDDALIPSAVFAEEGIFVRRVRYRNSQMI